MNKMVKKISTLFLLALLAFTLSACNGNKKIVQYSIDLDEVFSITPSVYILEKKGSLSENQLLELKNDMDNILDKIDRMFNVQNKSSDFISTAMQINQAAGIEPVKVEPEVIYVFKEAIWAAELSVCDSCNGTALFEPTIGPVWNLWGFTGKYYDQFDPQYFDPPADELIKNKLKLVNYKNIIIDEENETIFLKEKGMAVDLGGIAKGYAADCLRDYLIEKGFKSALIDVGGNVHSIGGVLEKNNRERPWRLGLLTPYYNFLSSFPNYYGMIKFTDKTVVTSGTYERYFMDKSGKRYHHILDPRTGYPINNGLIATTIVTNNSIQADALSTAIFALGLDEGMKKVELLPNVEAVMIYNNGDVNEIYISSGLVDYFVYDSTFDEYNYVFKGVYKGENNET